MYCDKCGSYMSDGSSFCSNCGAQSNFYPAARPTARRSVNFFEAISLFFSRAFDFSGRSRRSEYWYATLFNMIASFLIAAIIPDLAWIWSLIVLIPGLSMCIRRLHDVGKSGWWYLWILLPLIGSIILLVLFCQDSQRNNRWGRSPKY